MRLNVKCALSTGPNSGKCGLIQQITLCPGLIKRIIWAGSVLPEQIVELTHIIAKPEAGIPDQPTFFTKTRRISFSSLKITQPTQIDEECTCLKKLNFCNKIT